MYLCVKRTTLILENAVMDAIKRESHAEGVAIGQIAVRFTHFESGEGGQMFWFGSLLHEALAQKLVDELGHIDARGVGFSLDGIHHGVFQNERGAFHT